MLVIFLSYVYLVFTIDETIYRKRIWMQGLSILKNVNIQGAFYKGRVLKLMSTKSLIKIDK